MNVDTTLADRSAIEAGLRNLSRARDDVRRTLNDLHTDLANAVPTWDTVTRARYENTRAELTLSEARLDGIIARMHQQLAQLG